MQQFLSRSDRVKRGFNRLAIVVCVFGAISALTFAVLWIQYRKGDLLIPTPAGYKSVADDPSPALGFRLQALYGNLKKNYFDDIAQEAKVDAYPYERAISDARLVKAGYISNMQTGALVSLFLGTVSAAAILLLSWLIRGFMV